MPYSGFSLKLVKRVFELEEVRERIFPDLKPVAPSAWLLETLEKTKDLALISEKSRSEAIVLPLLVELRTLNQNQISVYSGAFLDADKEQGLNGECDFILGMGTQSYEIEAPIFCLVEAKDNDIEVGLGQCVAQMLGANLLNQQENRSLNQMYGCVTTGTEWQFLKLKDKRLSIDNNRYYFNRVDEILGILQAIYQVQQTSSST